MTSQEAKICENTTLILPHNISNKLGATEKFRQQMHPNANQSPI